MQKEKKTMDSNHHPPFSVSSLVEVAGASGV